LTRKYHVLHLLLLFGIILAFTTCPVKRIERRIVTFRNAGIIREKLKKGIRIA